jgi:hypothetical protein
VSCFPEEEVDPEVPCLRFAGVVACCLMQGISLSNFR